MSKSSAQKVRQWVVPIGIIIIAVSLVTLIALQTMDRSQGDGATPQAEEPEQPDLTFVETRDENDVQAAGRVDAPVGLVVYSDYQCPFCAKWTQDTLPTMMMQADLGNLRIEWRDVNQYGPNSERASLAAHAAGIQGKFWEYHDRLFPNGDHLGPEQLSEESLVNIAGDLGLDTEQFTQDMNSPETLASIEEYVQGGAQLGVSGTPTFVLGGEPIVGAQPESVFVDVFEQALEDAR